MSLKIGDRVKNSFNDQEGTIVKIADVAGQTSYWVEFNSNRHVFYEDELAPILDKDGFPTVDLFMPKEDISIPIEKRSSGGLAKHRDGLD